MAHEVADPGDPHPPAGVTGLGGGAGPDVDQQALIALSRSAQGNVRLVAMAAYPLVLGLGVRANVSLSTVCSPKWNV